MFKIEEFKNRIASDYQLDKDSIPFFIKHFLEGEYDFNFEGLNSERMKKMLSRDAKIELISAKGKSAEITINEFEFIGIIITINFYDNCQEAKTLYASMSVSYPYHRETINIIEFNCDGSAVKSYICSNDKYNIAQTNGKSKIANIYYKLAVNVSYYNPDDIKYFNIEDKNTSHFFGNYGITDYGIMESFFTSAHSRTIEKEDSKEYNGESVLTEFLTVRESINDAVNNEKNAEMIRRILKGE